MKRPYYLIQRNGIWYYRLNKESGLVEQDEKTWHSTGCCDRQDAEAFLKDMLGVSVELQNRQHCRRFHRRNRITLRNLALLLPENVYLFS